MILQKEIGVEGIVLTWFTSFLQNRTLKVKIGDQYSLESLLLYGVPQGSVLAPPLFNIYIRSLKKQVEPSRFSLFGFADDHQLIKVFLPMLQAAALCGDIQHCFNLITTWMNKYFLKLNSDKTKILVIIPPSITNISIGGTFIDGKCIRFVHHAKNLGIILDDELQFTQQVMKVVQSCFHVIRNLSKIKSFLSYEQLRTCVSIYIFSKLDYCNALYFGISSCLVKKLQSVQNSAARLLRKKKGFNTISTNDIFLKCHWLPVRERIVFKICLLVHKCLLHQAPQSLCEMTRYCVSERTLKLEESRSHTVHGDRAFAHCGPKLWNLLPASVREETSTPTFKTKLKSFLITTGELFHQKINER